MLALCTEWNPFLIHPLGNIGKLWWKDLTNPYPQFRCRQKMIVNLCWLQAPDPLMITRHIFTRLKWWWNLMPTPWLHILSSSHLSHNEGAEYLEFRPDPLSFLWELFCLPPHFWAFCLKGNSVPITTLMFWCLHREKRRNILLWLLAAVMLV